jgi:hypothetical protein
MPLVVQATLVARRSPIKFVANRVTMLQSASTGMIKAMKKIIAPMLLQPGKMLIHPGM